MTEQELVKLCNKVHAKGAAMSLDLAAVDPESPEGLVDWREFLSNVLPHVDFFVPSIEELCFMLDRPRYDEWMERAGEEDVTEILDLEKEYPSAGCTGQGAGCESTHAQMWSQRHVLSDRRSRSDRKNSGSGRT